MNGWKPSKNKAYSYPGLKWWQFIRKRRWAKRMQRFSTGERIKMSEHGMYFTDDFTVHTWIKSAHTNQNTIKQKIGGEDE